MFGKKFRASRKALLAVLCCMLCALMLLSACDRLTGGGERRPQRPAGTQGEQAETGMENVDTGVIGESNPYYVDFVSEDSYVLSASNSRYYSHSELSGMTRQQLYLAEREMFARYGGTFNDGDLSQFFNSKVWYSPNGSASDFNESQFTDIERVNLLLLRAMLMQRDGTFNENRYMTYNSDENGWILNFTDNSRIIKNDVEYLSEDELTIAYNEILARKGYIFEDDELQTYFSGKSWYVPTTQPGSFDKKTELSEIESENYACLQKCYDKVKGVRFSSGSKFKKVYDSYHGYYIFDNSDSYKLSPYDLEYLDQEELSIARNEIYARYGYSYNDTNFVEYFANCSWYFPTVQTNRLDLINLSETEEYNVKLIQAFELNEKMKHGEGSVDTKMSYYAKHDFMTMYLPNHWREHCKCIKPTGLSGNLDFYEKYHEEKKAGGWIFSMELVPTSQSVPHYSGCRTEVYGYVTTPSGDEYYVLKVMPNNSYSEPEFLEEIYEKMYYEVDSIFKSIEWKSGYKFTRA